MNTTIRLEETTILINVQSKCRDVETNANNLYLWSFMFISLHTSDSLVDNQTLSSKSITEVLLLIKDLT